MKRDFSLNVNVVVLEMPIERLELISKWDPPQIYLVCKAPGMNGTSTETVGFISRYGKLDEKQDIHLP
jgi:hypothetical protein